MRSFLVFLLVFVDLVATQTTNINNGNEEQAHQAIMDATETQFSYITNLLNTTDQKFAKLVNDIMQNYVNARLLGPDHVWTTTKNLIDQAGLNEADKDQFYSLISEALNNAQSAGQTQA